MSGEIIRVSISKIARETGLTEEQVEKSYKNLARNGVWKILRSYSVTDVGTGRVERFKVIKTLYLFDHPGEIDMCS